MKIAILQISPVFLDKNATWDKLKGKIIEAADNGAVLITWGETLIPGYPQWLSPSGGAKFNDSDQKKVYTKYWQESLTLRDPIIKEMQALAREKNIMIMGGIAEKAGTSIYCTLLAIGKNGKILGRHRKIKPTYEERLVWADGDAKGLRVYNNEIGKIGGLNCWENWIPYCRATLHQMGEMVHVGVWPGSDSLTNDISKFMAMEGRYWVIAASGILRSTDFDHLSEDEFPMKKIMQSKVMWQNGGSMVVNPRGEVVAGPIVDKEGILYADLDKNTVIEERHNFDYSGHYSRKDIFQLKINKIG